MDPSFILYGGGPVLKYIFKIGSSFYFLLSLTVAVLFFRYLDDNFEGHPPNQKRLRREYDFIILGGGSAGSVLASRLSEIPQFQVLLLEAGGDENAITDMPGLVFFLQKSRFDWKYKTEPHKLACQGLGFKRCNWPRGMVLGGSSTINYMMYVRGNKRDYDRWESLGNYGWGFKNALYYFKKSEDNRNPSLARNKKYHSVGGYLTVQEALWRNPLGPAFVKAAVQLGFINRDYNARYQSGFMLPQGTLRGPSRCSTSKAFLRPVAYRKNLHIAKHAFVLKILINPKTKRAYGVKMYRYGKIITVYARKEIIVSGGTVNSPQLMMLSGIGPREHLQYHGIPVIQDLPVGHNLHDHLSVGGINWMVNKPVSYVLPRYENLWTALKYAFFDQGSLASTGGLDAIGFVSTKFTNESLDWPDIQYHYVSGSLAADGGRIARKVFGISDEVWYKLYVPILYRDAYQILPILMRPESRGYITLRSKNPFVKPYITPNYLTARRDMDTLIEGCKIAMKISTMPALKKFGSDPQQVHFPGCEEYELFSDGYYGCLTRHFTITLYHPVGTNKMGPYWDPDAVVDPELRVYGISGLRVIDASIMPFVVTGNTNAPVVMIAEKGSDLIKDYWLRREHHKSQHHHNQEHSEHHSNHGYDEDYYSDYNNEHFSDYSAHHSENRNNHLGNYSSNNHESDDGYNNHNAHAQTEFYGSSDYNYYSNYDEHSSFSNNNYLGNNQNSNYSSHSSTNSVQHHSANQQIHPQSNVQESEVSEHQNYHDTHHKSQQSSPNYIYQP